MAASPPVLSDVVVTGMGAVTPYGLGVDAFAQGLASGQAAIGDVELFSTELHRTHIAGEVALDLEAALPDLAPAHRRRLSRSDTFGLVAAREALDQARARELATQAGLFLGSSTGGMFEGESFYWDLRQPGARRPRVSRIASQQHNGPTDAVARALGFGGPVVTLSSACSAATMALEAALRSLRSGEVDLALAGGADSLCQLTYAGFNALRAVDEEVCRPFQASRAGLSLGEGAGVLVLETAEHAAARGARVLATFAGAGSSCDAHHMTAPDEDGAGLALALEKALADARLAPEAIGLVNAHGTATPLNDAAEWKGLERVFGTRLAEIAVMATKGSVGHLLGACGGVEAIASILALARGKLPPAPNPGPLDAECPAGLAHGGERALSLPCAALSVNLAFGGANAAVVFRSAASPASEGAG